MLIEGSMYLVLLGIAGLVSVVALMTVLPSMIADMEPYTVVASGISFLVGLGILWYVHNQGFLDDLTLWPPELQAIVLFAPIIIGVAGLGKAILFWD